MIVGLVGLFGSVGQTLVSLGSGVAVGPSNPFPQTGFLIQAIQFDAAEIEAGNNAHDPAPIDNRHVAITPMLHQP